MDRATTDPTPVRTLPNFKSSSRTASLSESDKQALIDEIGEARNRNKLKNDSYLDIDDELLLLELI